MKIHEEDNEFIKFSDYSKLQLGSINSPLKQYHYSPTVCQKIGTSTNGYPNCTFGSTERIPFLRSEKRQDFSLPKSTMSSKLGLFSKAPRGVNLNSTGRDSPNPSKYYLK